MVGLRGVWKVGEGECQAVVERRWPSCGCGGGASVIGRREGRESLFGRRVEVSDG